MKEEHHGQRGRTNHAKTIEPIKADAEAEAEADGEFQQSQIKFRARTKGLHLRRCLHYGKYPICTSIKKPGKFPVDSSYVIMRISKIQTSKNIQLNRLEWLSSINGR